MSDDEELVPGNEAAEDYRRQRQAAEHGRDGFADEVRARFEDHKRNGRERMLDIARAYAGQKHDADALVDRLIQEATTEGISPIDDPYGHMIIRNIVAEITTVCKTGEIPIREGVVIGVTPTDGLHAYQSEVPQTGASIIDFAAPFIIFCNQFAILMARTLLHRRDDEGLAVICDPRLTPATLERDKHLFLAWAQLLARYAIEGWPPNLPRLEVDAERLMTRVQILHAMELFAVAHEYGHHVLLHGATDSSNPTDDPTEMEHDADGFARMISIAIGTNSEPPNMFEITGAGGVLMLGALDLVRRTRHVLTTGHTDFPPRAIHPPLQDRIEHFGSFDQFAPEDRREQFSVMRTDLLGVVEVIWAAMEPMLLKMFHEGGVKLEAADEGGMEWLALI